MNLVYKTYEISTNVEYTSGTRLNLSGVRMIKLINRPSGVQVWISTDSNGTNLFPLINRGDGWELPNDFEPLYNLYVFTKGVNSQDKLILSYTGEKNFFIFGSNSIEKVGEIESLGNKAQIDINNAICNYYSRIPLESTGQIFEKFYYSEYEARKYANGVTSLIGFPLSDEMDTIQSFNLSDDKYYRITILGHWDSGSDNSFIELGWDGFGGSSLHLGLCNDDVDSPMIFTKINNSDTADLKNDSLNLYQVNKFPKPQNRFNLLGIQSRARMYPERISAFDARGNIDINFDTIVSGKTLNRYKYFAIFANFYVERGGQQPYIQTSMHISIITTLSQAYSNVRN